MNEHRTDDPQAEQMEDLPSREVDARDAEQVKGGLNPQPLPPKLYYPIYQPPVYQPPILIRW